MRNTLLAFYLILGASLIVDSYETEAQCKDAKEFVDQSVVASCVPNGEEF